MNNIEYNDLQLEIFDRIEKGERIIAARCGWGSGKTSALVFSLLFISHKLKGKDTLLITDTNNRYNSVLRPEIEKWLSPKGWVFNHTLKQWIDTKTGSKVYCRSYFRPNTREATHNPIEGLNITSGVVLIDECQTLTVEVANKAFGRLRAGPKPVMILVGLPVIDAWWIKLAERDGYSPIFYSSYVNQNNLSEDWLEATKSLPPDERAAMVMNEPRPPSGLVYNEFKPSIHVIDDFVYDPSMTGRIAIDWGFRKPSILIIVYDESRQASIIVNEINPHEVTIEQLNEMILSIAVPREFARPNDDRILIDSGVADKAGRARSDHSGTSAFKLMRRHPDAGGLGLPLKSTTDPIRTDVLNGVQRLKRAFHNNKYLIIREVWQKGEHAKGNSIRKALLTYAWDNNEKPKKDGREDPLDALRYDCIFYHWSESFRKYQKRTSSKLDKSKYNNSRRIRPKTKKF